MESTRTTRDREKIPEPLAQFLARVVARARLREAAEKAEGEGGAGTVNHGPPPADGPSG